MDFISEFRTKEIKKKIKKILWAHLCAQNINKVLFRSPIIYFVAQNIFLFFLFLVYTQMRGLWASAAA
jgi:hypothetical protein